MFSDKAGNVVIISGNNKLKTNYISRAIDSGMNVLADKPLAINEDGFRSLENAFAKAKEKNVVLYDIMTERYNIYYVLQRALSQDTSFFGSLEKGTPDNPAIMQKSVHHFYNNRKSSPWAAWVLSVKRANAITALCSSSARLTYCSNKTNSACSSTSKSR
jgi:hypothetical protein